MCARIPQALPGLDLECCEREEIGELMRESKSGAHIGEDASRVERK